MMKFRHVPAFSLRHAGFVPRQARDALSASKGDIRYSYSQTAAPANCRTLFPFAIRSPLLAAGCLLLACFNRNAPKIGVDRQLNLQYKYGPLLPVSHLAEGKSGLRIHSCGN